MGYADFAELGEAEISDFELAVVDENVLELKIPVDDEELMEALEAIEELLEEVARLVLGEGFFVLGLESLDVGVKVSLVAVLHDEVVLFFGFDVVDEGDDVFVVDHLHDALFGLEELLALFDALEF